jgi:hypothetical protein
MCFFQIVSYKKDQRELYKKLTKSHTIHKKYYKLQNDFFLTKRGGCKVQPPLKYIKQDKRKHIQNGGDQTKTSLL